MKKIALISLVLLLTACQAPQAPTYNIVAPFNEKEAEAALKKGNNTIKGEAFLRQAGGGVITCAGYDVDLIPLTEYATERLIQRYGSSNKGYSSWTRQYNFIPDEPKYHELTKKALCNSTGHFEFKNIKDGSYYLVTSVHWTNGRAWQGGNLMQKVSVKGGETVEVILVR